MRVLLTGGSGFLGRYVSSELQLNGIDFLNLQRSTSSKLNSVQLDLLELSPLTNILRTFRPTHLIHLAWFTEHESFWNSEQNLSWIMATKFLVEEFCNNGGQHILITGTCAEYDWNFGYCIEDVTPTNPTSMYGISKDATRRVSELLVGKHDLPFAWARIFFTYGEFESAQRLVPSLFSAFRGEVAPFGVNFNSQIDLMHARDVARAILALVESGVSGVHNISTGKPVLISDLVRLVAKQIDRDPQIILGIPPKSDCEQFLVGANEKLKSLGWKQQTNLEEGLANYVI